MPPTGGNIAAAPARSSTARDMGRSVRPTRTNQIGLRPRMSEARRRTATAAEADRKVEAPEDREVVPGATGVGRTTSHPVATRGTMILGARMAGTVAVVELMQKKTMARALPEEELSWFKASSHRTTLDGGFSQEREEPGGLFVGRTTTSLPPGRPSRRGP